MENNIPEKTQVARRSKKSSKSELDIMPRSLSSLVLQLLQVDLARYCPRKLFYIIYVLENNEESADIVTNIAMTSKNFEQISSLTFITQKDVYRLLEVETNLLFPNQLKPLLLSLIENFKNQPESVHQPLTNAQLIKLKLIQQMYEQYVTEVQRNRKEKDLEDLLGSLSKECKKKQKKDSPDKNRNSPNTDEAKKKSKKETKDPQEETSYVNIPLEQNDVKFDENIFDEVWFYCITGFQDIDILSKLIQDLGVPISAIVKVRNSEDNTPLNNVFYENVEKEFFGNTMSKKFWEDTVLMEFSTESKDETEVLQEFLYTIRRLVDLKLTHLFYLRNLSIHQIRNKYHCTPVDCMKQYNKFLKRLPVECIDSFMILDGLMQEVLQSINSFNTSEAVPSVEMISPNKSRHRIRCTDPLQGTDLFLKNDSQFKSVKNDADIGMIHDDNMLLKILKHYKYIGPVVFDKTLSILKNNFLFYEAFQLETNTEDVPHTHERNPASVTQIDDDPELLDHFMYLCLFNLLSDQPETPTVATKYDLNRNLINYSSNWLWNMNRTKVKENDEQLNIETGFLFNTPVTNYLYKEKLNQDLMLQELFKQSEKYLYSDSKFSPETDDILIIYSDKLDEYGIGFKIFDNSVRTPVCIRDFSRYVTVVEKWVMNHAKQTQDNGALMNKFDLKELCPGVFKVKNELKIYEEYFPLLQNVDITEGSNNILENIDDTSKTEEIHQEFEETINNLQNYPNSKDLIKECMENTNGDELKAYDLGSNMCMITGHKTVFCSLDEVKVEVENTRLLQLPEHCTVRIFSDDNVVTVHSSKALTVEPYLIKVLLKNGTRISFILTQNTQSENTISKENLHHIVKDVESQPKESAKNDDKSTSESSTEQVVHCIEANQLQDFFPDYQTLNDLPVTGGADDLYDSIDLNEPDAVFYKVNQQTKYLTRLNKNLRVPIERVLEKIVSEHETSLPKSLAFDEYTKRYQANSNENSIKHNIVPLDFRICLPNGLFIRCDPDRDHILIKQEYACDKPKITMVEHEEFRLFTNQGMVLIKRVDGSITLLRSNGDIMDFEKPDGGELEEVKPNDICKCANIDDYKYKLSKLLKDSENCDVNTSRRAHIVTKKNHIVDEKMLSLLKKFDVPFLKKTILKFNGRRIKIQGKDISEKQMYHLTSQRNFSTSELIFERNDNFRSVSKNGSQIFNFPDGTSIVVTIDIADELVDDFVYIIMRFEYKHPYYVNVNFDFDKTVSIHLHDGVSLRRNPKTDEFRVDINAACSLLLNTEEMTFEKQCFKCLQKCSCRLNVKPFREGRWSPEETLLWVQDSYEKEFYADFVGNCSRNSKYIKGKLNKMQCDHYSLNEFKAMFVVNRNLGGTRFLTKQTVEKYINETKQCENGNVTSYSMIGTDPNITRIECRKGYTTKFSDRFFNKSFGDNKNMDDTIIYTTFRLFHEMFPYPDDLKKHISLLRMAFFASNFQLMPNDKILQSITKLGQYIEWSDMENVEARKVRTKEDLEKVNLGKCTCLQTKLTTRDKIERWKNECIKYREAIKEKCVPNYFLSEFCLKKNI
ncbi:hypothetical protein GWI33_003044 [Rhynchophorus ferrugineus]|uniref:Sperm-associated antigen 17 n=1 Tax=Rhynchophorus ferrugineus TaxID=354439 RepID=A0A834IMG1_RHYFE|nr:hypothetical protein GWI33_003044 [Rhynchophorus ferrugineus]